MLTQYDVDQKVKSVIEEKIPDKLIQERKGGGQTLSYISGNFVIDLLNRAFNYAWSWKIDEHWIQKSESKKFRDKNTGKETITEQPPIQHVVGTLTVYFKDAEGKIFPVSKSGAGSKVVLGGSSEQDSLVKAASTDALKKAASLLGRGAQLYRDKTEQKYFEEKISEALWTPELKEQMKDDFKYLADVMTEHEMTAKQMNAFVKSWSEEKYSSVNSLPPEEFKQFVAYVKEQAAEGE